MSVFGCGQGIARRVKSNIVVGFGHKLPMVFVCRRNVRYRAASDQRVDLSAALAVLAVALRISASEDRGAFAGVPLPGGKPVHPGGC